MSPRIPLAQSDRQLMGYASAAEYLGISLRGMKELAAAGEVPKVPIGHRVLFDRDDLNAYIKRIKRAS